MNKNFRKSIAIIIVFSLLLNSFIFPPPAHAFNLFRSLRRTTRFVLSVPNRATRWMGPVLGPIASTILTKNLIKNPNIGRIFKKAQKIDKVISKAEEVQKQIDDTKRLYNEEASKLDNTTKELEEYRKSLAGDLLNDHDIQKHQEQVAVVQELIEIHKKAAQYLRDQSETINRDNILKMLAKDFVNTSLNNLKDIVINETANELSKVVNPDILVKFLSSDKGINDVIDFLVEREIQKYDGNENLNSQEFKDRIRDSIKEQMKNDKDFFKKNWREKIDEILKRKMEELGGTLDEVKKAQDEGPSKQEKILDSGQTEFSDQQKEVLNKFNDTLKSDKDALLEIFGDDAIFDITKCPAGYYFKPSSGVGCVQINCPSVHDASHFSYTERCICGSSGSINENPDDLNKACTFPNTYKSCPGCVYICVHSSEKCPLEGVVFEE